MRLPALKGARRRLSYANVMATLAFFLALTGASFAGVKYIATTDPIPSSSDLAGTYGNPLIGAGKVTTAKIGDGAITSSKFGSSAKAPDADKLDGLDSTDLKVRFANVDDSGNLINGSGVVSTGRLSAGDYTVKFNRDITSCAAVVTKGTHGVGIVNQTVVPTTLIGVSSDASLVEVEFNSPDSPFSPGDTEFQVILACP